MSPKTGFFWLPLFYKRSLTTVSEPSSLLLLFALSAQFHMVRLVLLSKVYILSGLHPSALFLGELLGFTTTVPRGCSAQLPSLSFCWDSKC
ncbi:hypothetical protein BDY24DRAFT_381168 [Mrakia frigida]|uniref:uncharacterized protein n=1 Tax=Mrakia frigida TaxID=29902 RepID=UPI003FCC0748